MIVPAPFGKGPDDWFPWAESLVNWLDRKFGIGQGAGQGADSQSMQGLTGEVRIWAGGTAPDGWGECDGRVLNKDANPGLFKVWGTRWNKGGEGAGEFRAPDGRGRVPLGFSGTVYGGAATSAIGLTHLPAVSLPVTDPGHTHAFTPTPHTHTINDPGHVHSVGSALAGGSTVNVAAGGVAIQVGANTTLTAASGTTGVTANSTSAGGTNAGASTGISVALNGGATPLPITPLFVGYMQIFKF